MLGSIERRTGFEKEGPVARRRWWSLKPRVYCWLSMFYANLSRSFRREREKKVQRCGADLDVSGTGNGL